MNSAACAARGRALHLVVAGLRPAETDVVGDRAMEHRRVLRHIADGLPQRRLRHAVDGLAADQDLALGDVQEPQQQSGERRLAPARPADEADLGAGGDAQ